MRISIHEILNRLHKLCNRSILFGVIVLCGLIGFLLIEREAPPLEKNHSFAILKEDFLRAVRAYDIKSAKRLYGYLQEKNPYAPFVEEAAPAYLADIYIYYANKMSFNPDAANVFLAEARRLAPHHPLLMTIEDVKPTMPLEAEPVWAEKTKVLTDQITETEKVVAAETQSYVDEMAMLEQTIEAVEAYRVRQEAERLKNMLDKIETLALPELELALAPEPEPQLIPGPIEPPAPGVMPLMPEDEMPQAAFAEEVSPEKLALLNPEAEEVIASSSLTHPTDDACLLSFYTRNSPVSTCMDVVSDNQYGPALFVIGEEGNAPLAFTQQPITREAFNALCLETKQCSSQSPKAVTEAGLGLDLSDVENTVQNYNAFCQSSQSCQGLVSAGSAGLLEPNKLSEYVKVLSAKTGYPYRLMNQNDVQQITAYFEACVESEQCDPALGSDLAQFLKAQQGILLVRGM